MCGGILDAEQGAYHLFQARCRIEQCIGKRQRGACLVLFEPFEDIFCVVSERRDAPDADNVCRTF